MAKSFPLQVPITALDRFSGPLGKMAGATGAFGAKLKRVGKDLTTYVTLPALGLAAAAAQAGTDVRRNLNRVALATGAPADGMARLREEAEALGGETHTFRQVAQAMALLAEENATLAEIQAGTVPTLHLATIAQLELGESVESLDGILDAYGKTTEEAAHSVDVLAAAGQGAKLRGLIDALRTAGPLLSSTGNGLEGSVALLRELGDAGFDASRAGSAVAALTQKISRAFTSRGGPATSFFQKLKIRPGELRTSTGELRPLVDVVDLLRSRGAKAGDVVRAFGSEAGPALAALLDRGTDSIRKNAAAYAELNGESRRQVAILESGGVDATVKLANAWDRVATALAESGILDGLAEVVRWVGRGVEWFRALDTSTQRWIVTAGGVAAALGPVLVTLGSLVQLAGAAAKGITVLGGLGGAGAAGAGAAGAGAAAGGGLLATLGPLAVIAASVYSLAKDIPQGIETVVGMRREGAEAAADRAFFARGRPAMDAGAFGRTAGTLPSPSGAAGGVEVGGTVTIEIPNLPEGARVRTKKAGPVNLDVYAGPSLAGPL